MKHRFKDLVKELDIEIGVDEKLTVLSEGFDMHCGEREFEGGKEYGIAAYKKRDTYEEMYEELLDLTVWLKFTSLKIIEKMIDLQKLEKDLEKKKDGN